MACGTPVLALRRGSVEEVVDDGLTGHIVDNIEEANYTAARHGAGSPGGAPAL